MTCQSEAVTSNKPTCHIPKWSSPRDKDRGRLLLEMSPGQLKRHRGVCVCQAPHETLRETSCCPAVAVLKAYLGSIQPYGFCGR